MNTQEIDNLINQHYKSSEIKPLLDGIIDGEKFRTVSPRILWILKEPYDQGDGKGGWNYREDVKKFPETYFKVKTWRNISKVSYGILNNCDYSATIKDYDELYNVITNIAYINISKIPAGTTSNDRWNHFEKVYNETKDVLLNQIKFTNPDIIIGGNILYLLMDDLGIRDVPTFNISKRGRESYTKDNKLFINAYHPACRFSEESYFNEIVNAVNKWTSKEKK